ncbi:MAG: NrsF family protein [Pseudomonadota bacterium]
MADTKRLCVTDEVKNMDEKKLIDDLTKDLKPVKPTRCCLTRLCLWLPVMLFFILGFVYFEGLRTDVESLLTPSFMLESLLLFLSGLLAAMAAFKLSIPDTRLRLPVIILLTIPTFIWLGLNVYSYIMSTGSNIVTEVHNHDRFLNEVFLLIFMVTLPAAVLFYLIAKAAPTFRAWAAYAIILATASFGAIAVRMICGFDGYAHLFIYHFLPVIGLSVLGLVLGRFLLRW